MIKVREVFYWEKGMVENNNGRRKKNECLNEPSVDLVPCENECLVKKTMIVY